MDLTRIESFEDDIVLLILWACFYGVELSIGLRSSRGFCRNLGQSLNVLKLHKRAEVLELLVGFLNADKLFTKVSALVWKNERDVKDPEIDEK